MASTARDIMTGGVDCVGVSDTVLEVSKRLKALDVGAMPICGDDDRLKGMVTDRDIVIKVLAEGKDPSAVTAGDLGQGDGKVVTVGADDSVDEALQTMKDHKVRRLPVIDGQRLIGVITQADVAKSIDEAKVGDLIESIST